MLSDGVVLIGDKFDTVPYALQLSVLIVLRCYKRRKPSFFPCQSLVAFGGQALALHTLALALHSKHLCTSAPASAGCATAVFK